MAAPTAKRLAEALAILTTLNSQEADIVRLQFIADQKRIAELKRDLKAEQNLVETLANPTITIAELDERIRELETALIAIEYIAANESMDRIKIDHHGEKPIVIESDDSMDDIYEFAHVGLARCKADHSDWQKKLDNIARTALGENGETHD